MTNEEMEQYIYNNKVACPKCGKCDWTNIRNFNLMFSTSRGVTEEGQNLIYLRPETAQGEFVNFLNVQRSMRAKVPFGIAQIGKAFRNEITPGNFIFRTIEFEQMEHQWFCKEGTDVDYYEFFKQKAFDFLLGIGFDKEHLRFKDHDKLAFYARAACDIQFLYPMGWQELNGIHNRTNHDRSRHQEFSGKTMMYLDPITNEKYVPYVVEYSIGADRLMLAVLCEAYHEEKLEDGETRVVLKLAPCLAPYKACVLPLMKKNHSEKARELHKMLAKEFMCDYDESGSIGKRYRREDEIGTPFCITVDDDTLNNGTVTIRDRDTMQQDIVKLEDVVSYIQNKCKY
jgi:glycyl-tRNA synthetase